MARYGFRADGTELKSQWETILYFLQSTPNSSITSWQAIREFGFTRLAAVVKEIEKRTGIRLDRRDVQVETRYGATTYITEYWYNPNEL